MKHLHFFVVTLLCLGMLGSLPAGYTPDTHREFWAKLKCSAVCFIALVLYLYCLSSDAPFVDRISHLWLEQLHEVRKPE